MRRFVAIALTSTLMLQLTPLMAASAPRGTRAAAQVAQTAVVKGVAKDSAGQNLPKHSVQLRNLDTGQLAATTTSDASGAYSFANLAPANYVIEIVTPAGAIIGSSAPIAVAAGATVTVNVAATAAVVMAAAAAGGGISTALVITTIAVAAGIAGVVVVARDDASPSR